MSEGTNDSRDVVDPNRLAELNAQRRRMSDNLTPEQRAQRLVALAEPLLGRTSQERENIKRVLGAMEQAYAVNGEPDDDMEDDDPEIDDPVLEEIAQMRTEPEFDHDILDEMEQNYRESMRKR